MYVCVYICIYINQSVDLNNTINNLDPININRTLHLTTGEYMQNKNSCRINTKKFTRCRPYSGPSNESQ